MNKRVFLLVFVSALLASCAFTPHHVTVTAKAQSQPSSIGEGVTVALQVIDDRDSLVVGQRGTGMEGADITVDDIVPILERELRSGLDTKGFTVLPANSDAQAELEAKLRAFKFFIETGFWTGAENTNVVINVEAKKGRKDFDRTYRSASEERGLFVPKGSTIDEKLNAELSSVLSKIMLDKELMEFLAQ